MAGFHLPNHSPNAFIDQSIQKTVSLVFVFHPSWVSSYPKKCPWSLVIHFDRLDLQTGLEFAGEIVKLLPSTTISTPKKWTLKKNRKWTFMLLCIFVSFSLDVDLFQKKNDPLNSILLFTSQHDPIFHGILHDSTFCHCAPAGVSGTTSWRNRSSQKTTTATSAARHYPTEVLDPSTALVLCSITSIVGTKKTSLLASFDGKRFTLI